MKKGYIFIILAVIILIMFSIFNIFKNKDKEPEASVIGDRKNVGLNENFDLKEGDRAIMDDLFITYKSTSFPPESYTGDKEEFTYAQIEISENGDTLHFPLNKKLSSKVFHRYEIGLIDINPDSREIKIVIKPKEVNAKILEEKAVEIALKEAEKNNLENPVAINRNLEWGLWIIEVTSTTRTDVYLGVEVDANTGEVKRFYTDSRA